MLGKAWKKFEGLGTFGERGRIKSRYYIAVLLRERLLLFGGLLMEDGRVSTVWADGMGIGNGWVCTPPVYLTIRQARNYRKPPGTRGSAQVCVVIVVLGGFFMLRSSS